MFGRDVVLRFGGFFGVRKVDLRNTGMFAGCRRQAGIDCVIIMCISRGKARQFFSLPNLAICTAWDVLLALRKFLNTIE